MPSVASKAEQVVRVSAAGTVSASSRCSVIVLRQGLDQPRGDPRSLSRARDRSAAWRGCREFVERVEKRAGAEAVLDRVGQAADGGCGLCVSVSP